MKSCPCRRVILHSILIRRYLFEFSLLDVLIGRSVECFSARFTRQSLNVSCRLRFPRVLVQSVCHVSTQVVFQVRDVIPARRRPQWALLSMCRPDECRPDGCRTDGRRLDGRRTDGCRPDGCRPDGCRL